MKKNAFLFLIPALLIVSVPVRSQSSGIGLIGGLNFSNLNSTSSNTSGPDYSNLLGYKGGAVLDVSLGKNFGLRLEPMYLQKGAKRDGLFTDEHGQPLPGKFDVRLSYLELPVLFRYGFGSSRIRPYLMGGAGVSYLLSAKEKFTGGYALPNQEINIKDEFKSIDFEISGGAGLSFPVGRASLFVEGRYSHGLANISDVEGFDINTRGVQVMAGCTFPFGAKESDLASCYCPLQDKNVIISQVVTMGDPWDVQKGLLWEDDEKDVFGDWIEAVKTDLKTYQEGLTDNSEQEKNQKAIVERALENLDGCKKMGSLEEKKNCADLYLRNIFIIQTFAAAWNKGFDLYVYSTWLMACWLLCPDKVDIPWDLMNKALDFMIEGVEKAGDKDAIKKLKEIKDLKKKVEKGKETVEKLQKLLDKFREELHEKEKK